MGQQSLLASSRTSTTKYPSQKSLLIGKLKIGGIQKDRRQEGHKMMIEEREESQERVATMIRTRRLKIQPWKMIRAGQARTLTNQISSMTIGGKRLSKRHAGDSKRAKLMRVKRNSMSKRHPKKMG